MHTRWLIAAYMMTRHPFDVPMAINIDFSANLVKYHGDDRKSFARPYAIAN